MTNPTSPSNPNNDNQVSAGGATAHEQSQWLIRTINDFSSDIGSLKANVDNVKTTSERTEVRVESFSSEISAAKATIDSHCGDISDMKSQIDSLKRTIWIATGALIAAAAIVTFLLGGSIQDVLSSLEALKAK